MDMTLPYNDYACIDLDPLPGEEYLHWTVHIPNSDRFLPIKSDVCSLHKAIQAIKDNTIPMFNEV